MGFLIDTAKTLSLKNSVCERKDDIKQLFKTTKKILTWKPGTVLAEARPDSALPSMFSEYFANKIVKINADITSEIGKAAVSEIKDILCAESISLDKFSDVTEDEVERAIFTAPSSSSELDPLPTRLVKQCKSSFLKPLTEIVNISLKNGEVPENLKEAVIKPLIKKSNLDKDNLKNYRPVSNIAFVSKLVEKIVSNRINQHIELHNLAETFQSAYRKYHSTETALLRVQNDINAALQKNMCISSVGLKFGIRHH